MAETDPKHLVAEAVRLAEAAHAGQTDKLGQPYIEHVCAVARYVAPMGATYEIVGLLHDAVEDCPDRDVVSIELIADQFGQDVANAVCAMTRQANENYSDYLFRVRANPIARAIKMADIAHNVSRIFLLPVESERNRLLKKYGNALAALVQDAY